MSVNKKEGRAAESTGQYFHTYENKTRRIPYDQVKLNWRWLWKEQLYTVRGQARRDVTKPSLLILLISFAHK